jgi:hypothetical protein
MDRYDFIVANRHTSAGSAIWPCENDADRSSILERRVLTASRAIQMRG